MAIRVALNHQTEYVYDRKIMLGPQTVRLRPSPHTRVPILCYSLSVEPESHFINWQQDPHSNYLARFVFPEPTDRFILNVNLIVELAAFNPFDFFLEPAAETFPFSYDAELQRDLQPFLEIEHPGPELSTFLRHIPRNSAR